MSESDDGGGWVIYDPYDHHHMRFLDRFDWFHMLHPKTTCPFESYEQARKHVSKNFPNSHYEIMPYNEALKLQEMLDL